MFNSKLGYSICLETKLTGCVIFILIYELQLILFQLSDLSFGNKIRVKLFGKKLGKYNTPKHTEKKKIDKIILFSVKFH